MALNIRPLGDRVVVEPVDCDVPVPVVVAGVLTVACSTAAWAHELSLRRDPDCAYCADGRPWPGYVDYDATCALP